MWWGSPASSSPPHFLSSPFPLHVLFSSFSSTFNLPYALKSPRRVNPVMVNKTPGLCFGNKEAQAFSHHPEDGSRGYLISSSVLLCQMKLEIILFIIKTMWRGKFFQDGMCSISVAFLTQFGHLMHIYCWYCWLLLSFNTELRETTVVVCTTTTCVSKSTSVGLK